MKHLRELAKEFTQGKISRDDYRKQRTSLIQGILAGEIEVPDREFLTPLAPPTEEDITAQGFDYDPLATTEIAATKPGKKKQSSVSSATTPSAATSGRSEKPFPVWLFIAISAAVLILIIAITALFIFTSNDDRKEPQARTSVKAPVAGEAAAKLIRLFIQQNNWQEQQLRKFEENWQKIGMAEQQAVIGKPAMAELKNAVQKQIQEIHSAMAALGDVEASRQKQQLLVDFARNLGITDPAITVIP